MVLSAAAFREAKEDALSVFKTASRSTRRRASVLLVFSRAISRATRRSTSGSLIYRGIYPSIYPCVPAERAIGRRAQFQLTLVIVRGERTSAMRDHLRLLGIL